MSRGPYVVAALGLGSGLLGLWLITFDRRGFQASPGSPALEVAPYSSPGAKGIATLDQNIRTTNSLVAFESEENEGESETIGLVRAQDELASQINASLDGFLYINDLLDQIYVFANLPVDHRVDLEYDDEGAIAFRILGTPKGTSGHFLVGQKSFDRDGKELKFVQMEIVMGADESPVFFRDSIRCGPRLHMTVDYDSDGAPNAMALVLQRDIDLKESRKQGINAFVGTYTTGVGYRVNLVGQESCFSETFGLINGRVSHRERFNGISPLAGDTQIDKGRLQALFEALMRSRLVVSGSLSEARAR
jgi:hypothetical protein